MKRRLLSLMLCAVLLLGGCTQELPEENAAPGALLSEEMEEPPPSPESLLPEVFALPYDSSAPLDPVRCPEGAQRVVASLLYEGLFRLDHALEPEYLLCSAAEYNPESLVWTLSIRDGAVFSDGSPVTSGDAASSLQRAVASRRYQARFACVQSVIARRGRVYVTLNRPNSGFCSLLDIPVVKSGTADDPVPIGTGPYVFSEDGLVPNPNWQGTRPVDRIALVECSEEDDVRYQFTARSVQLMAADLIGPSSFSASGSVDVRDADTAVLQFIGFNMGRERFQDPQVRRALGLGIDRETVANVYLSGHALPAQFPVSPASPLYPKAQEAAWSQDAFAAGMTAAGLDAGEEVSLTLLVNSGDSFKVSAANFLASSLSRFDWKITVDPRPWDAYLAALESGDYDLYFGEVRLTADWDLSAFLQSVTGGAVDETLTAALEVYAASEDRTAAMAAVCRELSRQSPVLPLCFKRISVLTHNGVAEGLTPTASEPFYAPEGIRLHLAGPVS